MSDFGDVFSDLMKNWPTKEERKRSGQEARMMADDGVVPEAGKTYTVSPDFLWGDRSWIDKLWKVVAVSGPNVIVEIMETDVKQRVFRIDERAWYLVEGI